MLGNEVRLFWFKNIGNGHQGKVYEYFFFLFRFSLIEHSQVTG